MAKPDCHKVIVSELAAELWLILDLRMKSEYLAIPVLEDGNL